MTKKQIFNLAQAGGHFEPVQYYPLIYIHGSDTWRLALHRETVAAGRGDWFVSDPVSGYRVCRVTATYKGMSVTSNSLNVTQARAAALLDLDTTIARIGRERFSRVLNEAQKPKDPQ